MELKEQSLKERMKGYESEFNSKLDTTKPILARIDGQAFHTWTKKFKKEFNDDFKVAMQYTLQKLCEDLPVILGYTQSDEITLVFDRKEIWFKGRVQKVASLLGSRATYYFNQKVNELNSSVLNTNQPAFFDVRVFNVPDLNEVKNCLFFRQSDGKRNYIAKRARQSFTNKELDRKSSKNIVEMLEELGEKWDDHSNYFIYGSVCYREEYTKEFEGTAVLRHRWAVKDLTKMFNEDWTVLDILLER